MIEQAERILKQNICDNCLGRQFGQLLSGYSNAERGAAIRKAVAIEIDSGKKLDVNPNNFYGFRFRRNEEFSNIKRTKNSCELCSDIFDKIDVYAKQVHRKLQKYDYNNFLIGCRIPQNLRQKEEDMWERVGIEHCEPLKVELNREIGKRVEKLTGKKAEFKNPETVVMLDLGNGKITVQVNSLYISGYYQKLVRGIPQSKWGTPKRYKTSVEQLIGEPILKHAQGRDHKFHGAGREDIDARCLAWRPFVIEITTPMKRKLELKRVEKTINRGNKIKVKSLKPSSMDTVRKIKEFKGYKIYRVLVKLSGPAKRKDLLKIKQLIGEVRQRTPQRVLHRRADLFRERIVKSIKWKAKNSKTLELWIKTTAGLYVKEFISGDNSRTKPNLSELLGVKANVKELDVVKIENIKL